MRLSTFFQTVFTVAVATSSATALAIGEDANALKPRVFNCNKEAINACVASTGQQSEDCFGHLCAGRPLKKVVKRQDQCTEENLLQCAILDWNEAQACFQDLCL
ncbi:hypothetical protein F5B22DRAFT_24468 [Xylaria bambusicola]|uniref:uncharacterized protein n=1 Tax=Xylaria bambusicola TaxID=326684 RepID=UPI0020078ACB|nr:uncharacterized protein F5B22DRAFT_24468 [Xylaria bambusicola]KAI0528167.1 hypothetical protein F5B22DRAFT_24468 [Xylaria bambusicola]